MISFTNRFHGHNSLRYVYKNGQAVRSRSIIIKTISNEHRKKTRVAVVISKKILKSAVGRNLIRRRIYEQVRLKLPYLNATYDIAIIVTSGELLTATHQDITGQLNQLFSQTGVL
ncbi:ribonuclease P protein component [Candidatus Saccharibacteria bacterium CG11_big_fil_rev_8_21_14_0_20_41_19]|nr:ribonuclease P protein component [Candidatus Saccharibacteria bacterium]OIP85472.1 MAG: ribonuclease P protein component [Candidatus Saccharibacteria bacterium CG2_30_41_52]PIQ71253.1 MAG: ribonuclease P protein component [Candidatus Saccharibacteria bacterium CG11_big_fil_rev_8_21_14_0_20_41_19]PIZ59800.1 MAG: ribonuclease P protein component [Candidatus Saccharibacteria bacterium CG_4_10_14_0_2_um_filter_41_11]PJC29856.1 MAG: ribonuclease P protein component [Candidatus Saccharibacteria ba